MPAELAPEIDVLTAPESEVYQITAQGFCHDFEVICNAERLYLSRKLQLAPHKLAPEYIASNLKPDHARAIVNKIDEALNSDQNNEIIKNHLKHSERANVWQDEAMAEYLIRLVRMGITGGLVSEIKNLKNGYIKEDDFRAYRIRAAESNDYFVDLVDSDFGRSAGFTRSHLKKLIRTAYGSPVSDSFQKADSLEAGLAAEIGTRRYMEKYIENILGSDGLERSLRYGTINEDLNAGDLVYTVGNKTLLIDVKSGDKVPKTGEHEVKKQHDEDSEPQARHSKILPADINTYKVHQLHPATHRSFDENFVIIEPEYKVEIQKVIEEFETLVALE